MYSELYKGTESRTVLTSFDQSAGTLTGRHWFSTPLSAASPEPHTLEAESWPAMSAIDYLVTMGQLVQVLIAEHTGSSRQSGNLWMRQMEIELPHPPSPLPCELVSHTKPLEQNVIERQDHRVHHVITESRTSNGVRVVAKLAQVEEK
ncbi:AvrD family protein [Brevibacterium luteolum]|uniref:AvrD family protein n=1 Tax=Brevibacterium luteolum TaxID=199591 RepID=UPI001C21F64E|nr:hypothetical protein [Brevibacterium luteolum]